MILRSVEYKGRGLSDIKIIEAQRFQLPQVSVGWA